jgi:hypothetical protein
VLARDETLEREAIGRKARHGERGDDGAGSGDGGDLDTCGRGRGHDAVAGITDRRHAGIAQHEHVLRPRELDELRRAVLLVVVMQRDQARSVGHPEAGEEALRGACVLGGDGRRLLECLDEAAGGIPQVSDRRRREDDHALSLDLAG